MAKRNIPTYVRDRERNEKLSWLPPRDAELARRVLDVLETHRMPLRAEQIHDLTGSDSLMASMLVLARLTHWELIDHDALGIYQHRRDEPGTTRQSGVRAG